MKKILTILAATIAFSCSDSENIDVKAIEKIQTFYSKHIFGNEFANDSIIAQ